MAVYVPDDDLIRRLPLPLAQQLRYAANAKTPFEQTRAALDLWEAALKLLGATAVGLYAQRPTNTAALAAKFQKLARPSVGQWWELIRDLLKATDDPGLSRWRDALFGEPRDDLPRTAGLDAALRELLAQKTGSQAFVRLRELFDRLVEFR